MAQPAVRDIDRFADADEDAVVAATNCIDAADEDVDPVRRHLKQMAMFSAIDNVEAPTQKPQQPQPQQPQQEQVGNGHEDEYDNFDYDDDDEDDSGEDSDGDLYDVEEKLVGGGTSGGLLEAKTVHVQHSLPQFEHRIHLGRIDDTCSSLRSSAVSSLREQQRKENQATRTQDRSNRATSELVLDPRTRMMLFKMLNRRVFDTINGCVSTGKEVRPSENQPSVDGHQQQTLKCLSIVVDQANVYHATSEVAGTEMAVKIYKTSILVFKDRDRYVSGEFRFRKGYCKSNPRKMVKLWAEKEMRNYSRYCRLGWVALGWVACRLVDWKSCMAYRLYTAGIRCPKPILLRQHILIMEFIGKEGYAAPRLKDAVMSEDKYREAYFEVIHMMRTIYHKCHLVHADLSEYNMLYVDRCMLMPLVGKWHAIDSA
jgi:RIO kinase 1